MHILSHSNLIVLLTGAFFLSYSNLMVLLKDVCLSYSDVILLLIKDACFIIQVACQNILEASDPLRGLARACGWYF